jgi:hypothetical protein
MSTLRSAGMHTVEAYNGSCTIQVDNTDVQLIDKYILLIDVKDYISYDATKVKVSRVPNTTLGISYTG